MSSLRPPKYAGPIDHALAEQGRGVFNNNCAECHGTYGKHETYPNRRIPLDEIGTDPVRLRALTVAGRQKYARQLVRACAVNQTVQETIVDPDGYVAPPLDGVWASPPYFHNGSVPTLWHVLNPSERPTVWRRTAEEIDHGEDWFSNRNRREGAACRTGCRDPPQLFRHAAIRQK